MIRKLTLMGDHLSMGRQHAAQVSDLKSQVTTVMNRRLTDMQNLPAEANQLTSEIAELWEVEARSTLDMLKGIAEVLGFEWRAYLRYTLASFLTDWFRRAVVTEGCTVWATAAPKTKPEMPMLAKNRDYRPDHLSLQCLAWAQPEHAYRYIYLTSAASPGVFSSGMNERGLVVADTHVQSLDIGPGIPRYAVMMELLEKHERVNSALDYLKGMRHLGDGNLVLLDAEGNMAVVEAGHSGVQVLYPQEGYVVATNHFASTPLLDRWVDSSSERLRGNTFARNARVASALHTSCQEIDLDWMMDLSRAHGTHLDSICRHPAIEAQSITIASAIYLPVQKQLYLANGLPCQETYQMFSLHGGLES